MWLSVLLLGLAVNLEPTRICLVPLLLTRESPRQQLIAFLAGSMAVSLGFGLFALFLAHQIPFATSKLDGGRVKIILGTIALVIATILALLWIAGRRSEHHRRADFDGSRFVQADRFSERFRKVLRKGRSPLVAGLIGMGVGLPSPDYVGVLTIIATSGAPPSQHAAALVAFVLTGSLVVLLPLAGFVVSPDQTLALAVRFGDWTRSRSQIEYAGLLAVVGCLLIVLGSGWNWHVAAQ